MRKKKEMYVLGLSIALFGMFGVAAILCATEMFLQLAGVVLMTTVSAFMIFWGIKTSLGH